MPRAGLIPLKRKRAFSSGRKRWSLMWGLPEKIPVIYRPSGQASSNGMRTSSRISIMASPLEFFRRQHGNAQVDRQRDHDGQQQPVHTNLIIGRKMVLAY